MRLLVDSHVALWWLADADELGRRARAAIHEADEVMFSAVTPWELGIKRALGKLRMPDGLPQALVASGFVPLDITVDHAASAPTLPMHHRDPFDRMLIAQATLERLTVVTADDSFAAYGVPVVDARA